MIDGHRRRDPKDLGVGGDRPRLTLAPDSCAGPRPVAAGRLLRNRLDAGSPVGQAPAQGITRPLLMWATTGVRSRSPVVTADSMPSRRIIRKCVARLVGVEVPASGWGRTTMVRCRTSSRARQRPEDRQGHLGVLPATAGQEHRVSDGSGRLRPHGSRVERRAHRGHRPGRGGGPSLHQAGVGGAASVRPKRGSFARYARRHEPTPGHGYR